MDYGVSGCRCADILMDMDYNLHLVDQDALDFRHCGEWSAYNSACLIDMISLYVDSDKRASAALHCMRLLSTP